MAKWTVKVVNSLTGQRYEDHADALITAFGALNQWEWPSIPGLSTFEWKLMHSAHWDETYDVKVYSRKLLTILTAEGPDTIILTLG